MLPWLPLVASLALTPPRTIPAAPAVPADTGVWRGTLAGRRDTTQVRLLLARDAGRWRGRLRLCHAARASDFPLDSVRVDPTAARDDSVPVSFVVRRMAGHPRFTGTVSWDDRVVGTLRAAHGTRALSLARAGGDDLAALLSCR